MKKIRLVALILDTTRPYQRKMIRGVIAYARQCGRWSLYAEEDPLDKLPDLRAWHGHGIITAFTERRYAEAVHGLDIPVVGIEGDCGWYEPGCGIPYFSTDDDAVTRMAVEHLLGKGFPRLAYCGMPRSRHNLWSEKRAQAFKQYARQAGVPCWLYVGQHLSTRKWPELQRGLSRWLRSLEKPVGIMAANDARARHVLEACRSTGTRVPEDVAVIGVDNDELMCEVTDPPLSSIEQGAHNLGYLAAELLDRMMSGRKPRSTASFVLPERVVARRSTDYLAVEDSDVATALQYIRQHACEHIRLDDVLEVVAISRSTLQERFHKIMRKTIHDEIQQTMLHRAQQLIVEGKLTLKQVAKEAGFAHPQHLTNLFHQRLGQTPGQFQKKVRLGLPYPPAVSPE